MIKSLVALAMIAIFTAFAVRTHLAAVLLYWWFGLFKPQYWMWWDLSALRLPFMAAILLVLQTLRFSRLPQFSHPIAGAMLALVILALLAELTAGCPNRLVFETDFLLILVFVVLVTERALVDRTAIFYLMLTVTLSFGFFTTKAGISAALSGGSLYGVAIEGGAYSDSNAMALSAVMMMCMALFTLQCIHRGAEKSGGALPFWARGMFTRRALSVILLTIIVGSGFLVVTTESRGSALSLALGMCIFVLLQRRRMLIVLIASLTIGGIAIIAPVSEDYKARIASAFADEEELDGSAASRPHFWKVARKMAAANPLGVGIGCYADNYSSFDDSNGLYGRFRSVHSSHFSILAEIGYAGLAVWTMLFLMSLATLLRIRRRCVVRMDSEPEAWYGYALSNAMITMICVFAFGGSFYELAYNDFIWIGFVVTIAASRLTKNTTS